MAMISEALLKAISDAKNAAASRRRDEGYPKAPAKAAKKKSVKDTRQSDMIAAKAEANRQADVQRWTNEEMYAGMDRNEKKRDAARYQLSPTGEAVRNADSYMNGRRGEGERARIQDTESTSNDSLGVLRTERMRRLRNHRQVTGRSMERNMGD